MKNAIASRLLSISKGGDLGSGGRFPIIKTGIISEGQTGNLYIGENPLSGLRHSDKY